MQKRKVILVALGVTDEWNPLDSFRRIKAAVPMARMAAFGAPTRLSREVIKDWAKEPRAVLGLYGWRGTTYEMHDWTLGETYMKLRDAFDRGPFAPILFPPDMSISNEAGVVCAEGDGEHLPPVIVAGWPHVIDNFDPRSKVLPIVPDTNVEGTVALFVRPELDVDEFIGLVESSQAEMHFIDPIANAREAKGLVPPQLRQEVLR